MKTLVAVSTCRQFEGDGFNDALRETWLKDCAAANLDYRLFVGEGAGEVKDDTVALNCGDGYEKLSWKTLGKLRWGVDQGYDFIFCCMADTYARPERLARCGYEKFDSFGAHIRTMNPLQGTSPRFIHGGCGYFLSQFCAKIILASPPPDAGPAECFEDMFVTSRLVKDRNFRHGDALELFSMQGAGPRSWNQLATKHIFLRLCKEQSYTVAMLRDEHQDWLNSQRGTKWFPALRGFWHDLQHQEPPSDAL